MRTQSQGPTGLPTSERLATLARASANALRHKVTGERETETGTRYSMSMREAETIIADWPMAPREGARQMIRQYGPPNEATRTKLFWYRTGPWKRIEVTRDVIAHNFPSPHSDYLTQWIDYSVPVDKFDEIGRFDGSCLVDRTAGEAGARCDSEAANIITLNLMHEIILGKRTVDDARKIYADNMVAYTMGRAAPYADQLLFSPAHSDTHDPDEARITDALARQSASKLGDWITGFRGGKDMDAGAASSHGVIRMVAVAGLLSIGIALAKAWDNRQRHL